MREFALVVVDINTERFVAAGREVSLYLKGSIIALEESFHLFLHTVFQLHVRDDAGLLAQLPNLGYDVGSYIRLPVFLEERELARQTIGTTILLDGGDIGILPVTIHGRATTRPGVP